MATGFDIKNDPSAGVGAATYATQAQPDEQDMFILASHAMGTGVLGFNPFGVPYNVAAITVAAGSNGTDVTTYAGSGTLNTTSAAAFKSTGTVWVATSSGTAKITYTGKTGTSFTGCTTVSGTGTLTTGNAVTTLQTVVNGAWYQIQGTRYISNIGLAATYAHADADSTYGRWDLVSLNSSSVGVITTGTAAANPCFPAVPTDSDGNINVCPLAAVYIPPAAVSLVTAQNMVYKFIYVRPQVSRVTVADADYVIVAINGTLAENYVGYTSITTSRNLTLPAANAVLPGQSITIADESGSSTKAINIRIKPSGSDTIEGVAVGTSWEEIREAYGSVTLASDGVSNWVITAVTPTVRREVFTSGTTTTWRKPLTSKHIDVFLLGGGGAGGSGEKRASGTACGGGGGGQAGGYSYANVNAADLSATETIVIGGAGAAGGATTSTGNGANGGNGGDSTFTIGGTIVLFAQGGSGGGGGTGGAAGTAGTGTTLSVWPGSSGGAGAKGSATAAAAVAGVIGSRLTAGGGGGGGGATTAPATQAAAAGGNGSLGTNTDGSGAPGGGAGTSGATPTAGGGGTAIATVFSSNSMYGGSGGGGGGGTATNNTTGGNGGGGVRGGGGGGGGNGLGTGNGGNGGSGGGGYGIIVSYR